MTKKIFITGSVAFDYLMTFPGRFSEVFVADRLDKISVSFLVDEMRKVRGGVAPNIAYNLAILGGPAAILATAGEDAADYREWLRSHGIDVDHLRICPGVFTASFLASTDQDQNQIATFYAGAMARASELSLHPLKDTVDIVLIGPNDPKAVRKLAAECRELGIPFVYDPSQQIARMSGEEIVEGLEGASVFIGNEYEFSVLEKKTGFTVTKLSEKVPVVIQTRGSQGSVIWSREDGLIQELTIPPAKLDREALDPTGVGDAFRGGLLAARNKGLPWETAGRVGSVAAVFSLETLGPQPERYTREAFLDRYKRSFERNPEDDGLGQLFGGPEA
ncbi:MAG: carbohydrate kinase family protein [Thermoanaerobaculia bacterium]|nr:carbohydrate kinase family protein [Thermoanaerobaculia bacterium]